MSSPSTRILRSAKFKAKEQTTNGNGFADSMPLEVLMEVLQYVEPLDLLHLARTSKGLRAFLLNRNKARSLWQVAISNVQGLPSCPEYLSEPAYTYLAFVPLCHGCCAPCETIGWELRMRCCWKCYPRMTIFTSHKSPTPEGMGLPTTRRHLVTEDYGVKVLWKEIDRPRVLELDWKAATSRWKKSNISCNDFSVQERSVWQPIANHSELCRAWEYNRLTERANHLSIIREQRIKDIQKNLRALGWLDFFYYSSEFYRLDVVAKPEPLTPEEWSKIYPELAVALPKIKEEEVYQSRTRTVTRLVQLGGIQMMTLADGQRLTPQIIDVLLLPAVRDVIGDDVNTHQNHEDLEIKLKRVLPKGIEQWIKDVVNDLKELARKEFGLGANVDPSRVASVVFRCTMCNQRLRFDAALTHYHLHKILPNAWSRGTYFLYEKAALKSSSSGNYPLSFNVLQGDLRSSRRIENLFQTVGLYPARWAIDRPRRHLKGAVCKLCDTKWGFQYAVQHCIDSHLNERTTQVWSVASPHN